VRVPNINALQHKYKASKMQMIYTKIFLLKTMMNCSINK